MNTRGCATTCPVTSMGLAVLANGIAARSAPAASPGIGGSGKPSCSARSAIMMPTPPDTVTIASGVTAAAPLPSGRCQAAGRRPRDST